jgi:O-antigen/teichoic acid export membrane protein
LEIAIPICKSDDEAKKIANSTFVAVIGNSLLSALIFYFIGSRGVLKVGIAHIQFLVIFGFFATWFLGFLQILFQMNIRTNNLNVLSVKYILDRAGVVALSCLIYKQFPLYGLIIAQLVGQVISICTVCWGNMWKPWQIKISFRALMEVLRDYRDFPTRSLPSWMSQLLTTNATPFLFSIYYTPYELGLYSLAQRLNDAPNTIIQSSLATVYYRRILSAMANERRRLFLIVLKFLIPIVLVGILLIIPFAKNIFSLLFGQKWEEASLFLLALLPLSIGRLFYLVLQPWMYVLRRLDIELLVSVFVLIIYIMAMTYGLLLEKKINTVVFMMSTGVGIAYLASVAYLFRLVSKSVEEKISN